MARILSRCPIWGEPIKIGSESHTVREDQIIVWLSLSVRAQSEWVASIPRFPAVLDTGNSHHLFIHEGFLRRWSGVAKETLHAVPKRSRRDPLLVERLARVWIHCNLPGQRDEFRDVPPILLERSTTIMVCPENHAKATRLPVLGLRAILANRLRVHIHGGRRQVSLATASRWWWPF
jgi:hypothetical protein